MPLEDFFELMKLGPTSRVPGTAVFMTSNPTGTPPALMNNFEHNHAVHEQVVLITIMTEELARVPDAERVTTEPLQDGFTRVVARYGFMESPDVVALLMRDDTPTPPIEHTTFFLGNEIRAARGKLGDVPLAGADLRVPGPQRRAADDVLQHPQTARDGGRLADLDVTRSSAEPSQAQPSQQDAGGPPRARVCAFASRCYQTGQDGAVPRPCPSTSPRSRMRLSRFLVVSSILLVCGAFAACSNDSPRKPVKSQDASTADGSQEGGGAGGEASVDAQPETTPEASPEVGPDAPAEAAPDAAPDAPVDAPMEVGLCFQGQVYDYLSSLCLQCPLPAEGGPADAGDAATPDSGDAEAGSDAGEAGTPLYQSTLTCNQLEQRPVSVDLANHEIVVDTGYPLQILTVQYDVVYSYIDPDGGFNILQKEFKGTLGGGQIVDNKLHVPLPAQLPAGSPISLAIVGLTYTDACGRDTVFSPVDNCQSSNPPLQLSFAQGDSPWPVGCSPSQGC